MRLRMIVAVTVVALLQAAAPASAEEVQPADYHSGSLTFLFENDIFLRSSDDNYTAGGGLIWVSEDVASYRKRHFARRVSSAFSFLPVIDDPQYQRFVAFALGLEVYTPTDLTAVPPPADQQPYAGVLFLDTSIYGRGPRSLHAFTFRVGCVGPCSGAAGLQERIHEWVGSPIPQGWDYQLENEFLLNLNYAYHRRFIRRTPPGGAHYDVSAQGGFGFGNYYIGTDAGVVARVGHRLPDNYSAGSLRTGGASRFVGLGPPPGHGWSAYAFAGARAYGIARFLPTDGNTFADSASVARDDLVGTLVAGFVVGYGHVLFSWNLNRVGGFNEFPDPRAQDFATLSLTVYLARGRPD